MAYMFIANGFEETEAIGCLDVLKRAGVDVCTAGVGGKQITGSHNVTVTADILTEEIDWKNIDGIILPGGMPGTTNLQADETVIKAIRICNENSKLVAAICAAPMILGGLGILQGKNAVCFPGFEKYLTGAKLQSDLVVADGNVITAKGAGASMLFGAKIADWFKPGMGRKVLDQIQHI